jgi:pimeloyl-ACP methyl ester carboxylesterase
MISYPKKHAFALSVVLVFNQTSGMGIYAQPYFAYPRLLAWQATKGLGSAWNQATATRGRTIATLLAASYLGYELYRFASLALKRSSLEHARAFDARVDTDKPCATLFAHGLSATGEQARDYDRLLKINHAVHTFNFADAGKEISTMRQCGLAQEHDVQQLKEQIDVHADKNLILFGLSRGASTAIATVGMHKPKNVKGLIVESPFDDMRCVVAHLASYASWIPGVSAIGNLAASFIFPNYSTCALRPIDLVTYIPDDIPVLFICSEQDQLVSAASTKRLYNKLKAHRVQRGINNVYLIEAEYGAHAKIAIHNQERYQQAVHAFHKKAGLPASAYYAELATCGQRFLTQP